MRCQRRARRGSSRKISHRMWSGWLITSARRQAPSGRCPNSGWRRRGGGGRGLTPAPTEQLRNVIGHIKRRPKVTWNERIDLRHRQRKIFENSDNPRLRRAVIAGYDLHYDDSQGAWQDCVEGYETSDVVGYNQMARRLRHALHVANNGGRRWYPRRNVPGEYVQFGRLQYWNGTSWVNVPFGTPVVTNNQIFWDHTLFSLKLFVNWHRIKIEAVLKSSGAARPLRWA